MPDERHQPFPPGPRGIAHARILEDRAGHVRPALGGDKPDLALTQGDTAMGLAQVRAAPGARLQLEDLGLTVERPHARQRQIEVPGQDLGTPLEDILELLVLVQRDADRRPHREGTELSVQLGRHPVERPREGADLVVAIDHDGLAERARLDLGRRRGQTGERARDPPGDDRCGE